MHHVQMWYACFVTLDTVSWPQFQAAWHCNDQWGKCLIECCSLAGALPGGFGFHGFKWGWEVVYLPILLQVEYWSCWSYSFMDCWACVISCDVEVLSNHNLQSVPSQHNKFQSFQCRPMCLMLLLHWVWQQKDSVWDLIFVLNHFKLLLVNQSQIGWSYDIPWAWLLFSWQSKQIQIKESSSGLHKWCWIVLNVTSIIGQINQQLLCLLKTYCEVFFAPIKDWTRVACYQQHKIWNCFWPFFYAPHNQICLSVSIR